MDMDMDQSWPPSIASSIDTHGSLGGGSQGDGLGSGSQFRLRVRVRDPHPNPNPYPNPNTNPHQCGGSVCSRLSSRRGSKDSVLERSA